MWEDPIVNEVRQAREAHALRFNYDLGAICRDLREQQAQAKAAGRKVVSLEPNRPSGEKTAGAVA